MMSFLSPKSGSFPPHFANFGQPPDGGFELERASLRATVGLSFLHRLAR
jgi:hypothetical protein